MLPRKAAQSFIRRLHRQSSRGNSSLGKICLCLYLFGTGNGIAEQSVQVFSTGACLLGLLLGLLYLAEDLILAHHHGIQTCRHGKQMTDCLLILIEGSLSRHVRPVRRACFPQDQLLLQGKQILPLAFPVFIIGINFRTVAGGDYHALRCSSLGNQKSHQLFLLLFRKSKQFPDLQRRRLMADTDKPDTHYASTPFLNSCVKVLS